MALLKRNGLKALTTQEAFVKLDQNPELKELLKGSWLYLEGRGADFSGFHIFNEKGELAKISATNWCLVSLQLPALKC